MRNRRSVLSVLCIAALFAPLTGQARPPLDESGALTLQQPTTQNEYIIDGAEWACSGTTCRAGTVDDMPPLRSCKRVVAITGAVSAFSWRGRILSVAELAECNVRAKK
jgi:hypothetical protein